MGRWGVRRRRRGTDRAVRSGRAMLRVGGIGERGRERSAMRVSVMVERMMDVIASVVMRRSVMVWVVGMICVFD